MDYISEKQIARRLQEQSIEEAAKKGSIEEAATVGEHILRGGIALSAATLGTSLFLYTHPGYTWNDLYVDTSTLLEETVDNQADAARATGAQASLAMEQVELKFDEVKTSMGDYVHSLTTDPEEEALPAQQNAAGENTDDLIIESGMPREEALALIASNDALKEFKDEGELSYDDMISKIEKANRHAGIYDEAETAEEIHAEFAAAGADTDTSLILSTAMGPMLYYSQDDSHWKDYEYGGNDPMSGYGCGPTVCSMLINAFGNETEIISPIDIADWAANNKQYALHSGSMHTLIPKALEAYGLTATSVPEEKWTPEGISAMLKEGHVIVALVGPGTFTNGGHFLILTEESTGGKIRIADSNNLAFTLEDWDPETIISELNWADASGAPLWSISRS